MRIPSSVRAVAGAAIVATRSLTRAGGFERHSKQIGPAAKDISAWQWQMFSQHGEDGILFHLLDVAGPGPGKFVEFGFGQFENNALAFAIQRKATGLYIDGSQKNCRSARTMFGLLGRNDIKVTCAWIDRDNIDQLIADGIGGGEIDLLSVDVDGNDYWLWNAITAVTPRIVIFEYNASFGPSRAATVPYDREFDRTKKHETGFFHGASLAAAAKLGRAKGYALVGTDAEGVNAFLVQRDLLKGSLREMTAEEAFRPHKSRIERGFSQQDQERIVYSLAVVDV